MADIQPCVVVDDGVISASDLVSSLKHAVDANNAIDAQEINVKLSFQASHNNSVLNSTLKIKDINKVRVLIESQNPKQSYADILQLCNQHVMFWQDYGIAKTGEFTNLSANSAKFRLKDIALHKFFNVNRNVKKEETPDIVGLYQNECNYDQWAYSEPYDGSKKIESFQEEVFEYNTQDPLDISDFVFVTDKSGEANSAGQDGGIYERGKITALIKQENKNGVVDNVSNMCEFLGSIIFAHAKPQDGAKVFLAKKF